MAYLKAVRSALIAACGVCTAWNTTSASKQPQCGKGHWATALPLQSAPDSRIDHASVGVGQKLTVVVGSPDLMFRHDTLSARGNVANGAWLRVLSQNGTRLGSPNGSFVYAYPRAAVDSHNQVHVVWGEPDVAADRSKIETLSDFRITSLWHAAWRNGVWSTPTRIYVGRRIGWDPSQSSSLVADTEGGIHLAVPVDATGPEGLIAYLHSDSVGWSSHAVIAPSDVIYADLVPLPRHHVALAYVSAAGAMRAGTSESEMFVTSSVDDGISWSPPKMATEDQVPAYEPRMVADNFHRVHMVWIQHDRGGSMTTGLWYRRSSDGGHTWTDGVRLPLAAKVRSVSLATDKCGVLHVAVQSQTSTGPRVGYTQVVRGAWTPLVQPFPETVNGAPHLWLGADDRIHMLRYDAPMTGDWGIHYRPVISTLDEGRPAAIDARNGLRRRPRD